MIINSAKYDKIEVMKNLVDIFINKIEIKKSKFIAIAIPLELNFNIKDIIKKIKKEYPKARHYCYAYKFNQEAGSNDDGEPKGTAGVPILKTIMENQLNKVLICVVRYFGGIKLGASNLLRTYLKAATEVLAISKTEEETHLTKIGISFNYKNEAEIRDFLEKNNISIISSKKTSNVFLEIALNDEKSLKDISYLITIEKDV